MLDDLAKVFRKVWTSFEAPSNSSSLREPFSTILLKFGMCALKSLLRARLNPILNFGKPLSLIGLLDMSVTPRCLLS